MDAFNVFLILHLAGAAATAWYIGKAMVQIITSKHDTYLASARTIGASAGYELVTGALLALNAPSYSPARFCANIAVFLLIIAATELLLYASIMKQRSYGFPLKAVLSPIAAGLAMSVIALMGM